MAEEGFNHRGTLFAPSFGYLASSDLKHMRANDQEAFVRDWFFSMYDPQTSDRWEVDQLFGEDVLTFYADQEIKAQFSGVVPADVLEVIISDATRHAEQWVATDMHRKHYNYEERPYPEFEHEDSSRRPDVSPFLRPDQKVHDKEAEESVDEKTSSHSDSVIVDIGSGVSTNQSSSSYSHTVSVNMTLDVVDETLSRTGLQRYLAAGDRNLLDVQEEIEQRLKRGVEPRLGTDHEKRLRSELNYQASALQVLIKTGTPKWGAIGHNQPPEDLKIDEETKESLADALETIEQQTRLETPDAQEVSKAAGVLRKVVTYLASKGDKTVDAFCDSFGRKLGTGAAFGLVTLLYAVLNWLDLVTLPF